MNYLLFLIGRINCTILSMHILSQNIQIATIKMPLAMAIFHKHTVFTKIELTRDEFRNLSGSVVFARSLRYTTA
ncbi:MAG: hypothetical protein C0413_03840 [Clostridiales bacterium]|nr:hypothetical protein [Clostridiales bacterium]